MNVFQERLSEYHVSPFSLMANFTPHTLFPTHSDKTSGPPLSWSSKMPHPPVYPNPQNPSWWWSGIKNWYWTHYEGLLGVIGFIMQAVALIINPLPFFLWHFHLCIWDSSYAAPITPLRYTQRGYCTSLCYCLSEDFYHFPEELQLILSGTDWMVDHFVSVVQKLSGKKKSNVERVT